MAGKKRRKASSAIGKATAKRKTGTSIPAEAPMIHVCMPILRHLLDIASSRIRSEHVVQTFYDGKCWTDTKKVPADVTIPVKTAGSNFDCYWIILATNIMNRLLILEKEATEYNPVIANYVTALADALATILLSDKSKLTAHQTANASRSTLCRAILTTSLAALYGMQSYDPQKEAQRTYGTYEAAVATLDRLVHLRAGCAGLGKNCAGKSEEKERKNNSNNDVFGTIGKWNTAALVDTCTQIEEYLGLSYANPERGCIEVLLKTIDKEKRAKEEEAEKTPPTKRSTRSRGGRGAESIATTSKRKGSAKKSPASAEAKTELSKNQSFDPSPVVAAFEKLLASEDFGNRIDGRVAIKRWASIAIVWSHRGEGQRFILREIHRLAIDRQYDKFCTPHEKSRLMSTMMYIVIESGKNCGVRAPTGGIEQYLRSISPGVGTAIPRSPEAGKSKRTKKGGNKEPNSPDSPSRSRISTMRRADIRDWTTVVIYDYVQNRKKCLLENVELAQEDEDSENDVPDDSTVSRNTDFSELIMGLCRNAESSVYNSSYNEHSSLSKALQSIASAFCLELAADPSLPLDTKMISFALSRVVNSLRMIDPNSTTGAMPSSGLSEGDNSSSVSEKEKRDFETRFLLQTRLPTPIVPTSSSLTTDSMDLMATGNCTFAGIVSSGDSFTDEHAVALAIRAFQIQRHPGDTSPAAGKLLTFLVDLVRRAYDTRKPKTTSTAKSYVEKTINATPSGKRKRPGKESSTNRRTSRRRKTESGYAESATEQETFVWLKISPEMSSVAILALTAIKTCLINTKGYGSCTIRKIIRCMVTFDHMLNLVELGEMLDKIMIKSRCKAIGLENDFDPGTTSSASLAHAYQSDDFTASEIRLWETHMNMCQIFGRGQLRYEENSGLDPLIWDSERRKKIYKALTAPLDAFRSRGIEEKKSFTLPAANHTLLVANMSCVSDEDKKDAEIYIVNRYINFIKDVFDNLETLTPEKFGWYGRILNDDIPLSYNDARTFMLALNGLSRQKRQSCFERLVKSIRDAIESTQRNKAEKEKLFRNADVSGFFARVLVVCYSLMNSIVMGRKLRQNFSATMGGSQIRIPSFITQADWYCQDRTFMGIFGTWESSSLPDGVVKEANEKTQIPRKSSNEFRSLLEKAFQIGFDAAPYDHCHLLFTAWNGLDQMPQPSSSGELSPELIPLNENYSKNILQLRDDVCSIYRAINDGENVDLKGMVLRASELTDTLLKNHIPDDEEMKQDMPLPAMVLLASLPAYIAAAVSGHTKPGNDYFSTTLSKSSTKKQKSHRGYYSDSDHSPSDCESDEDIDDYESEARIAAMSRLRECCDAFGAAPVHPDWLDVSCSLRDGIRPVYATEVAGKAINTLSHLAKVAFTQYKRHQSSAVRALKKEKKDTKRNENLYSTIIMWSRTSQYPNCREWPSNVATITKLSSKVADYLSEDTTDVDIDQTKACWCPYAGQRLRGILQEENKLMGRWELSDAVLRAGGEWELLLAEALSIACLNTNEGEDDLRHRESKDCIEVASTSGQETSSEMAKAQLWRTVLMSAISHLVPAAALLRLGLGKVGRKPHPFAFHENDQDPYDASPLHFCERLNGIEPSTSIPTSLQESVFETLSLLARLSIEAEDPLSTMCHSVASHLVVDSNTFLDLEAMQSMRCAFMGLNLIRDIAEPLPNKDAKASIPFVVERLITMIEDSGTVDDVMARSDTDALTKHRRLHYFLGDPPKSSVDTVATKSIDIFEILSFGQLKEICDSQAEIYKWSCGLSKEKAVDDFVSILCEDSLRVNSKTRSRIAFMLSRLGIMESHSIINSTGIRQPFVISAIVKAFTKVDKKHLKSVVLKDLCGIRGNKSPSQTFRRDMASIFTLLLFPQSTPKFEKAKFVHDMLMGVFDSWKKIDESNRDLTLSVLLTYGTCFNSLFEIGSKLVKHKEKSESDDESVGEACLFYKYFDFIKSLKSVASKKAEVLPKASKIVVKKGSSKDVGTEYTTIPSEFPRWCSFIKRSGFHEQHWYHCYTCNLVADKGCCTLCALVCHRDHDVSYSRHSSFFCDCAAEDDNSVEQGRVSCKCIKSTPNSQLDAIYKNEHIEGHGSNSNVNDGSKLVETYSRFEGTISAEVANYSFPDEALESAIRFLLDVKNSHWLSSLFRLIKKEFKRWKTKYGDPICLLLKESAESSLNSESIFRSSHLSEQKQMRRRRAKLLELRKIEEEALVSVCVATGFVAKFSSDSSTHDALTLARLSRNDVSRSILAIDSRGRMILAEPSSLLLCSPMAIVNARNPKRSDDERITRSQMCILGTLPLSFNVVGVRLCAVNERHLVVWGTSEACVLILKADYSGSEDTINLTFEVDEQDSDGDVLVNCEWLPGSQTHVAVGVSRYVRLFDVCRSEKKDGSKRAQPVIGYNLGFEASLRDLSIVPQKEVATSENDSTESSSNYRAEHTSKMFLLLENGRLHSLEIKISNGKIESPSELHFEPSECVSISTEGIRPRSTSSVGLPGASTRTLGEGSKLVYLKQSRCLLYKCKAAAVVALMIGNDGNVEGSFELIPHTIPIGVLGADENDDMYSISGPYTLWTELGMVYRKGETFFRVVCLGRATRSGHSKLLCIDFNEKKTKIREISCSSGMGLSLDSFEGLAAFTAPVVHTDTLNKQRMTGERTFLCALTSEGNLQIFGEDLIDMIPTSPGQNSVAESTNALKLTDISLIQSSPMKKFPLTIFEQLINVSKSENLIFSGEKLGFDSKELKSRLSRENSSSFVCPRRQGCCFIVSLSQNTDTASRSRSGAKSPDLIISAIRVLVGSTCDYIPSRISVQGRSIDVTPRLKRWYNIPLTEEEIARGMRSGFVSIWIGQSFDPTNAPVIDSVEVFASERNSLDMVLSTSYFAPASTPSSKNYRTLFDGPFKTSMSNDENDIPLQDHRTTSTGLILGVRATTTLCEFISPAVDALEEGKDLMRQLIQITAVHPNKQLRESVEVLSGSLVSDSRSRWSFQDENMLVGCSQSLVECNAMLNNPAMRSEGKNNISEDMKWKAIRIILQDCLNVASLIARERPNNYLQSMGNIQENDLKSGSIAIEASKLILQGLRRSAGFEELIGGSRGIITLSLTEMAIVVYMDDSKSTKDFVQLSRIREFIDVENLSTCEAISTFFQDHESEQKKRSIPDLFVQMEAARRVAYQCDSCGVCPMKEVRYTILKDDYGIDLCNECYDVGKKFASNKRNKSSAEVIINGKSMGRDLTCAHMKKMEPVSLEKMEMDVEQLDIETRHLQDLKGTADEDEALRKGLKCNLGESASHCSQQDLSADHRGYDYFLGELYSFVMEQLSYAFKKERCDSSMESLIKLALDLVKHSRLDSLKRERAEWFVKDVSRGIEKIVDSSSQREQLTNFEMSCLVACLRGLSSLVKPDSDFDYHFPVAKSDTGRRHQSLSIESMTPKLTCDVHGILAVRRRCDKPGANKDRRFYVCGKEKGQRCNFFKWADDGQKKKEHNNPKSQFNQIVQSAMLDHQSPSGKALYDRLCGLLEEELFGEEGGFYEVSVLASNQKEKKTDDSLLKSFYSAQNIQRDFNDGVFCSKEKLLDVVSSEALVKSKLSGTRQLDIPVGTPGDRGALLLEASLDLLTIIADDKTEGISRWFSILCEITMATNKHSALRSLATKVLKTLCGGNRKKYHYIRDHFTFCFQLKKLYHFSYAILEAALIVKEKTRQCSAQWKGPAVEWATLGVGGLIGTQDLISEDSISELNLKGCGKALDDMWTVLKSRGGSWRQFCGFRSLPLSQRHRKTSGSKLKERNKEQQLFEAAPIKVLFWIASCLTGINQVKILRMIDFALFDWKERKTQLKTSMGHSEMGSNEDSEDDQVRGIGSAISKPEELLLNSGNTKLVVGDIIAMSLNMVQSGKTTELRRSAFQIVLKLSRDMSDGDQLVLFENLLAATRDVGLLGKASIEYLNLLQMLTHFLKPSDSIGRLADYVADSFIQQMEAIKYDKSNHEWTMVETNVGSTRTRKRFDLSRCIFCLKLQHHSGGRESTSRSSERKFLSNSGRVSNRTGSTSGVGRTGATISRQKWHSEQVSEFSRCRLDSLKETCSSNEFNLFYKLKNRVSISDIHLTVSDPRGRYVKTISIFFVSRPTSEALKSDNYSSKWQKIATLNLARGGSRVSASLSQPIVATNIRVEFTEFYERPGNKERGTDGSMVLHCPRCTRPVTNAHGVCVTCGEVAFQCRKCRHINYDRLDAFLCVECGYTCCGSFSIELNAAVASNAIAITDDNVFDKSIAMYGIASSIEDELRENLGEKMRSLNQKKHKNHTEFDSFIDASLERALFGLLPIGDADKIGDNAQIPSMLDRFDKPGSIVKYVAHTENNVRSNGRSNSSTDRSERARSLLRLAQQIRSGSSSSSDGRRSTDIIIRHLGRGMSLENVEDESGLREVLRRGSSGTIRANNQDSEDKDPKDGEKILKAEMADCQKMLILLREAWRESYELQRRIIAWKNLNSGALVPFSPLDFTKSECVSFTPSHCSVCGGSVALQILVLWLKLFLVAPTKVFVAKEFFRIIFQEDIPSSHCKGLQDIKNKVIISIATNSRKGAEIVLVELRKRLAASRDMNCADVLGKIMKIEGFDMANEYAKLAMDILSSRGDPTVDMYM